MKNERHDRKNGLCRGLTASAAAGILIGAYLAVLDTAPFLWTALAATTVFILLFALVELH